AVFLEISSLVLVDKGSFQAEFQSGIISAVGSLEVVSGDLGGVAFDLNIQIVLQGHLQTFPERERADTVGLGVGRKAEAHPQSQPEDSFAVHGSRECKNRKCSSNLFHYHPFIAALRPAAQIWSAATCRRFLQATCRRRMPGGPSANNRTLAVPSLAHQSANKRAHTPLRSS